MKAFRTLLAFCVAALLAAVAWGIVSGGPTPSAQDETPASSETESGGRGLPAGWSYIAEARVPHLAILGKPSAGVRPIHTLQNPTRTGSPLTLSVGERRPGWVQVGLPVRPNHSTGWVRRHQVALLTTAYSLHVDLSSHVMALNVGDRVSRRIPIGVGRSVTPTPNGRYFITELLRQPDPSGQYGPFAFGLSAYSGVIKHFGEGGNGQIGIHGTDEPWLVGGDVSHGCIRVKNGVIRWLAHRLPLGTPVIIGS